VKRSLLILIALLAAVAAVPGSALAYATTGTGYPLIVVDNSAGDQSVPHVSGHYASYNVLSAAGANTIGYFDFATQTNGAIAQTSDQIDALSDIFGNTIVFTRISPSAGTSGIFSFPIGGTATEVAPVASSNRSNPAIGGPTIAWEDVGVSADMNPEIVADSGGTVTRLTTDLVADQNPSVSPDGSTVVWEKCSVGSCDVYAAVKSGALWSISAVAATSANETSPDTNGTVVVYESNSTGAQRVHVAPLNGGADTTIPLPAGTTEAIVPGVSGNFVAFSAGTPTGAAQHDIWVYDLADGSLHQITNTPQDNEYLPDIDASTAAGVTTVRIVWEVFGGASGWDVYGSQFQVSSQPSFTDQFLQPLVQSTDPASPVINTGKNGRVIPVKAQISQGTTLITDQNTPGPVTIAVSKLASCSTSAGSDPITSYADAGQSSAGTNQFHYDAGTQAWLYNLDTKALGLVTGNCYRIDVAVNGTQIANAFAVFQPTK
jgi:hypothetical protein